MRKLKKIPKFKNEDAEREFWSTHDSIRYIDWSKGERVEFPNLKPSDSVDIKDNGGIVESRKDDIDNRNIWPHGYRQNEG